jgi:aminoglycoside phosphotransferase (APT) family kinase protein
VHAVQLPDTARLHRQVLLSRTLSASEVTHYLLRAGLIDARDAVEDGIDVFDISRRNVNFRVAVRDRRAYVVKQSREAGAADTVTAENAAYELLERSPRARKHLARRLRWDAERGILTLEALGGGKDLAAHHARTARFSRAIGTQLGAALAALHALRPRAPSRTQAPWVLRLAHPWLQAVSELSAANIQLVRLLQGTPHFAESLDELEGDFASEAFVHNDVKLENILVARAGRRARPVIVDWEMAGEGDPAWDLGGLFGSYLGLWLASIPITGDTPPDQWPGLARHPLEAMQPLLRAAWARYRRDRRLAPAASVRLVDRAARYAGARLVQSAFERSQLALTLDSTSTLMLQVALNMLTRPLEGRVHLLGIGIGE